MWLYNYFHIVIRMGKINVKVQKDIDAKFRETVFKRKGMKKGNLTEALEEAMLLWVNTPVEKKQTVRDTQT